MGFLETPLVVSVDFVCKAPPPSLRRGRFLQGCLGADKIYAENMVGIRL